MAVKLGIKDYIWSYVGIFVSVGSSVLMLPFALYYLSDEMYGLWGVFQSISAITILFDFGFSTTFARNVNYCWSGALELKETGAVYSDQSVPNFALLKRVMKVCQLVFLIISGIALVCMLLLGTPYILYICRDIKGSEPVIAWAFYMVAIFFNLYYGYYNSFLLGVGAVSDSNRVMVLSRIVQIFLTVTLLACGFGIVATGFSYLAYGFAFRLLSKRAFFRFKKIGESLSKIDDVTTAHQIRTLFLIVWHNASREGLVSLSAYFASQVCTILCPLFLPLSVTGIYSLAVQLANTLSNVSAALYNANQPVLQSAYITNDMLLFRRTLSLIVVSFVSIYFIGLCAVLGLGLPILRLIRPETTPSAAIMLGVAIYYFILKFRDCYASCFSCTNRLPYVKSFIFSSLLCVILVVVLLGPLHTGLWGLIAAQIASQAIYNVWHWPLAIHQELALSVPEMCRLGIAEVKKLLSSVKKKRTT